MSYSDDYSQVFKYSVADLRSLAKSIDSKAMITHAVDGRGDNLPLLALADHFDEHQHPLGNYIRRVAKGEGVEGDEINQGRLRQHSAPDESTLGHFNYPVVGDLKDPYIRHSYYKLPTGHFFHISLGTGDAHRSFLLPVGENDVHQYVADMNRFNDDFSSKLATKSMVDIAKKPAPAPSAIYNSDMALATTPVRPSNG